MWTQSSKNTSFRHLQGCTGAGRGCSTQRIDACSAAASQATSVSRAVCPSPAAGRSVPSPCLVCVSLTTALGLPGRPRRHVRASWLAWWLGLPLRLSTCSTASTRCPRRYAASSTRWSSAEASIPMPAVAALYVIPKNAIALLSMTEEAKASTK